MAANSVSVKVFILDKEYQFQCGPDEKERLRKAAVDVDLRMRQINGTTIKLTTERMAVLTALNLANELQDAADHGDALETVSDSIIDMQSRIERVLAEKKAKPNDRDETTVAQQS